MPDSWKASSISKGFQPLNLGNVTSRFVPPASPTMWWAHLLFAATYAVHRAHRARYVAETHPVPHCQRPVPRWRRRNCKDSQRAVGSGDKWVRSWCEQLNWTGSCWNMVGRGSWEFSTCHVQSCLTCPVWSLKFLLHRKRMKKWSEEIFDKSWITLSRVFHQNRLHTESNFTTSTSLDKHLDIWQCIRTRYEDSPWFRSWIRGSLQPNFWDSWYF